jgi:hypothetical protein
LFQGVTPQKSGHGGLINKIDYIPISLKIPQRNKKQKIVEIQRKPDFIEFGLYPHLVLIVSLQVFEGDELDVTDIGHHFLGFGEILDGEILVASFA